MSVGGGGSAAVDAHTGGGLMPKVFQFTTVLDPRGDHRSEQKGEGAQGRPGSLALVHSRYPFVNRGPKWT